MEKRGTWGGKEVGKSEDRRVEGEEGRRRRESVVQGVFPIIMLVLATIIVCNKGFFPGTVIVA